MGPHLGPLLTEICTFVPLLYLSLLAAMSSMHLVAVNIAHDEYAKIAVVSALSYFTVASMQAVSSAFIGRNIGKSLILTRTALQYLIAALYAMAIPTKQLALAIILLSYPLLQNHHLPVPYTIDSLNQALHSQDFLLVARQESLTGYISVLENVKGGFRAMRCDHSLLGGEWIDRRGAPRSHIGEPIYSCFVMLEAVRLVEIETLGSKMHVLDSHKQALVM